MFDAKSMTLATLLTLTACGDSYHESYSAIDSGNQVVDLSPVDITPLDPDHPFGRNVITTEEFENFGTCFAESTDDKADFFNSGRGCDDVIYEDNEDGTHSIYCTTEPTCDQVHTDGYLAVPNTLDWSDFGNRDQMMCQDNNVTLLYFSNKASVID